jgi:diguanylate cyclase (GGDEF)-like protein
VLERRAHPPAEERDLDALVRHVALADWLVLGVVLLHLLVAPERTVAVPIAAGLAVFAAFCVALRVRRLTGARPALALEIETWVMTAFITFVAWLTGGPDSPLQSLYLLPIVLASLVLPTRRLLLLLAAIATAYVLVAALRPGGIAAPAAFAGRALTMIGPLLVVAWLTAQLGTAVLAGRRRAAALTDGDALTGLATRRVFMDRLQRELGYGERRGQPCSMLVVDLDGSRRLNEQYGAEAGNAALQLVAEALRRTLRETDLAARWGGDEFAVLLAGTDRDAAQGVAQRIRHAVYSTTLEAGARLIRCSVSIGAAAAPRDGRDADAVVASAERRLALDRDLRRRAAAAAQSG